MRTGYGAADGAAVFSVLSRLMVLDQAEVNAIGLCLQAESYLKTAEFCRLAEDNGSLRIRFNSPISFLLSHGIELTLKAWLQSQGYDPKKLRHPDTRHNLTKLYKLAKRNGLVFDEMVALNKWAAKNPALHLSELGVITESERVNQISSCRRNIEYWRHLWLLGKLHNAPYVLRYHKVGLYRYPDIDFLVFCTLELCRSIAKSPEMQPRQAVT